MLGSIWTWGARVLFGWTQKPPRLPRVHGPSEIFVPKSFRSYARGSEMLRKALYPDRQGNKDWTQDWVYMGPQDRHVSFWTLTSKVNETMAAVQESRWIEKCGRNSWGRRVNIQTGRVWNRWTEILITGCW